MSEPVPSNQRTTATPSLADRFHPLRSDTEPVDQETGPHIKGKPGEKPVEIPEKIGRFAIRGILGAGSYGIVYRGFDAELGRDVAVKVPRIAEMSDADIERFLRDARAAAVIHHQNICPVYDVGKEGRQPFIVLHLVAGDTLAKIIEQRQFLPPRAAAAILRKLAQGVAKAHTHGVVHRDLKPANVLFDRTGNDVLITDFGLAVFAEETLATADGRRGTPAYMAPEQARGAVDEIDPKTDIYALGVILYHLMTGTTPFRGSIESVMYQVVHEQPRAPSGVRPGIDPEIEAICLKAMAKKPEDRFASAKDLSNVLGDYLRKLETPAMADTSEADADATASGQEFLAPLLQFDDAACRTESKRDEPRRKRGRSPNFIIGGSVLAVVVLSMAILGFVLIRKPFSTAINGEDEARTFSPVAETMMGIEGVPPATSKVGETREVEIAPGVAMAFCWIPAGECQLGSKPAERNAMLKFLQESKEPDWMRRESEERRPKFRTDGFWMGKFEVTQAEWAAVMKGTAIATPSAFRVGGK
ncbi:MAG TPA: bifunctional serine/threonine-protein kinase/formylglycine-generating enzyme family protein, partial [Urbifossiella sp.]